MNKYDKSILEFMANDFRRTLGVCYPLDIDNILDVINKCGALLALHDAPFSFAFEKASGGILVIHTENDNTAAGFAENVFDVLAFVIIKYGYLTSDRKAWEQLHLGLYQLEDIQLDEDEKFFVYYLKYALMIPLDEFEATARKHTVFDKNGNVISIDSEGIANDMQVEKYHIDSRIAAIENPNY